MGESPERLEPWSIHGHSEIASNRTHKSGECTVFHRTVAARVNCHNIKFFAKAKPQECFSSSFAYNKTHALLEKATTDGTCQAMVLGCTFSAIARTPVSPRGNGPAMQMTPTLLRVCLLHTHTHPKTNPCNPYQVWNLRRRLRKASASTPSSPWQLCWLQGSWPQRSINWHADFVLSSSRSGRRGS